MTGGNYDYQLGQMAAVLSANTETMRIFIEQANSRFASLEAGQAEIHALISRGKTGFYVAALIFGVLIWGIAGDLKGAFAWAMKAAKIP